MFENDTQQNFAKRTHNGTIGEIKLRVLASYKQA